jgi:hypothetical protein
MEAKYTKGGLAGACLELIIDGRVAFFRRRFMRVEPRGSSAAPSNDTFWELNFFSYNSNNEIWNFESKFIIAFWQ